MLFSCFWKVVRVLVCPKWNVEYSNGQLIGLSKVSVFMPQLRFIGVNGSNALKKVSIFNMQVVIWIKNQHIRGKKYLKFCVPC